MKTKVILTILLALSLGFNATMIRPAFTANRVINKLEHRANNAEIALEFCKMSYKRPPKNKRVKWITHEGGVAIRIGW